MTHEPIIEIERGPSTPYDGARIALLTRHGKERALAPLFQRALGAALEVESGYDTDQLGTFTREIPRIGDQLEAARRKALLASELAGLPFGLASEGSFGPGPMGLGAWNREVVLFVDRIRDIEIVGQSVGPGHHHSAFVRDFDELHRAAADARFPEHALVLRPNDERDPRVWKGIRSWRELDRQYLLVKTDSASGVVFVESDLRAHVHPTRMTNIGAAAADLLRRMKRLCPSCSAPGYGVVRTLDGLPCRDCETPTEQARALELGCVRCRATEVRPRADRPWAEPFYCPSCNP